MTKFKKYTLGVVLLVLVGGYITQPYWTKVEQNLHVNKTERVEEIYMVYTDKGVFLNEDSWHYLKFDSSDLYNKLASGKDYTCKSYGFRVPFLSMYPNIVSCEGL